MVRWLSKNRLTSAILTRRPVGATEGHGPAGSGAHDCTASLYNDRVTPQPMQNSHPFATPHDAKPTRQVDCDAGLVLRENAALEHPEPVGLRIGNQRRQQSSADSPTSHRLSHVYAVLGDAGVAIARRNRRQRRPSHDDIPHPRNHTVIGEMVAVLGFPVGRVDLKRGITGGDTLGVNATHGWPVPKRHGGNSEISAGSHANQDTTPTSGSLTDMPIARTPEPSRPAGVPDDWYRDHNRLCP